MPLGRRLQQVDRRRVDMVRSGPRVRCAAGARPIGYPVTQPTPDRNGCQAAKAAMAPRLTLHRRGPIEDVFPAAAVAPNGHVYLAAYRARRFRRGRRALPARLPPPGRITCDTLGHYIDNTRLDYKVRDLTGARTPSTPNPSTRITASAAASSATTPTSPSAPTTSSTPSGRTATTCRRGLVLRVRVRPDPDPPGGRRHRERELLKPASKKHS